MSQRYLWKCQLTECQRVLGVLSAVHPEVKSGVSRLIMGGNFLVEYLRSALRWTMD